MDFENILFEVDQGIGVSAFIEERIAEFKGR